MLPMFMGVTKLERGYDFLIATEIETIPTEELMPSIEEVKSARQKEK
jgi:branched-chain amino acid transport system substrate-binding protein